MQPSKYFEIIMRHRRGIEPSVINPSVGFLPCCFCQSNCEVCDQKQPLLSSIYTRRLFNLESRISSTFFQCLHIPIIIMNHLLLLLGASLALSNLHPGEIKSNNEHWLSFKQTHNKSYESDRLETLRLTIFTDNKRQVDQFNAELSEEAGFELGLNHLADLSNLEVRSFNGFKLPAEQKHKLKNSPEAEKFINDILNDKSIEVPDEVDWRTVEGRVTRVKDQGQCGSCWAFAATGALEGQEPVKAAKLGLQANGTVELSEQNLVDCVKEDAGCDGGLMIDAFNFIKQEDGIDSEASYPYEAKTKKCRFQKDKVAFKDAGGAILPKGDEEKLKEMVAKFGPVAVAIDASSIWFQLYSKGVYVDKHCKNGSDELDHGVLVVGYGTDKKGGDYWIVVSKSPDMIGLSPAEIVRTLTNNPSTCPQIRKTHGDRATVRRATSEWPVTGRTCAVSPHQPHFPLSKSRIFPNLSRSKRLNTFSRII